MLPSRVQVVLSSELRMVFCRRSHYALCCVIAAVALHRAPERQTHACGRQAHYHARRGNQFKFPQVLLTGQHRRKDGQTDGRRFGRRDGRRDGRTDGRTDRRTDGRTEGRTDSRTDGRTEGTDGQPMDRRTDGRTEEQTDGRPDGCTDGRTATDDGRRRQQFSRCCYVRNQGNVR